jgi:hypothetical protein
MSVIDDLIQNGNRMLVRVAQLDQEIAGLQATRDALPSKYATPDILKPSVPGELPSLSSFAAEAKAIEEAGIDRDIAGLRLAKAICKNQADHNLATPHSYYLGQHELNPINPAVPTAPGDLVSDCHQYGLITWGTRADDPSLKKDGQMERV